MAFITRGGIYCSFCGVRVQPASPKKEFISCQNCGHPNVHIRLMFDGEALRLYDKADGKPYSYKDAVSALVKINEQIEEGSFDTRDWKPIDQGDRVFQNALAIWLERKDMECDKGKLAPSTLGNYQTYARKYYLASKHLTGRDVREIRLKHLQLFYDDLPGSPKYRKNIMDALHTFFFWLKRWGEIESIPPWPEIEEVIQKERFALSYEEQVEALKNLPASHRDIFEFMMETGLRPGEVCALQWQDIDFKARRALIRRTYSEATLRQKTKQKKEQWIPLSDRACEIVDGQGRASAFLFSNPDTGRGYRYKVLNRLWNKHSGTGVDLYEGTRHSFCTQMVEQLDLASAQKAMRHTDQRSTKRYDHSGDAKIRDAMNRRGNVIEMKKEGK